MPVNVEHIDDREDGDLVLIQFWPGTEYASLHYAIGLDEARELYSKLGTVLGDDVKADLLAACEAFVEWSTHKNTKYREWMDVVNMARNAIAKAKSDSETPACTGLGTLACDQCEHECGWPGPDHSPMEVTGDQG